MSVSSSNVVALILVVSAVCVTSGCFGGGEPLVISTPRKGQLLAEDRLRVEDVGSSFVDKDIRVSLRIANVSGKPVKAEIAVKWLDEELKPVAPPAWSALTILPDQDAAIESSAPADRAIHYELLVKVR